VEAESITGGDQALRIDRGAFLCARNADAQRLRWTCIRGLVRSWRRHLWRRECRAIAISLLMLGGLQLFAALSQPLDQLSESGDTLAEEPITPVPGPSPIDPRKIKLGERLFGDPRLSRDDSRSCLSCHDVSTNGASTKRQDVGYDGSNLQLNTPTVFNAALSFSFGWEGKISTIESDVRAVLENPAIMGIRVPELVEKLRSDPDMRQEFIAAYNSGPDAQNIVDAIASFVQTLVTPDSRFDRWL